MVVAALRSLLAAVALACSVVAGAQVPASAPTTDAALDQTSATLSIVVGHRSAITAVEWSRDEALLLSASGDNTAKLWHVGTGALLRTISAPKEYVRGIGNAVTAVSIVEDANALLCGGSDGVRAYELSDGRVRATLERPSEHIAAIATSERGSIVVTAGNGPASSGADVFLRIRGSLGEGPRTLPHEGIGSIRSLALSGDNEWLLVGASKIIRRGQGWMETAGAAYIYSTKTGDATRLFDGTRSRDVEWVAFAADDRDLYLSSDGKIHRFDRGTGKLVRSFAGHVAAVARDGSRVVTSADATSADAPAPALTVWNTATGAQIATLPWPSPQSEPTRSYIETLAFSPSGRQLAVGLSNGKLAIWDFAAGRYLRIWEPRASGPSKIRLVDSNGDRLITARDRTTMIWDLRAGKPVALLGSHTSDLVAVASSSDGTTVATATDTGAVNVWDGTTGALNYRLSASSNRVSALAFSSDARLLFSGGYASVRVWRVADGHLETTIENGFVQVNALAVSPRGDRLAIGDDLGTVQLFSLPGYRWQATLPAPAISPTVRDVSFDPQGHRLIVGYGNGYNFAVVYNLAKDTRVTLGPHQSWVDSVGFDPTGRRCVTGSMDETARLWDAATGKLIHAFAHRGDVLSVGFAAAGTQLVTYADEAAHLWDLKSRASLLDLIDLPQGHWVVVGADGRFDAQSIEESQSLRWLMPDDKLRPLPFDLFMRDYYEPRLLSKLTDCRQRIALQPNACALALPPVRSLRTLNRTQPRVEILQVRRGATADSAWVDIRVGSGHDPSQRNGKTRTAAYDLKLFRNGQMVAQFPKRTGTLERTRVTSADAIERWRADRKVVPPASGVISVPVRLASRDRGKAVTFTAYALNADRVKSATSLDATYRVPADIALRVPRAYVITIGVNRYDDPRRRLTYAASDASVLRAALAKLQGYEVVAVTLVSDYVRADDPHSRNTDQATKSNIRALLQLLSGRPLAPMELQGVPGIEALRTATPDDALIVTFSGHGDAKPDGGFYLLPSDSRTQTISTDELAQWLHPLDAGQIALIIDACHSSQSVEGGGFKPGPMGDRSFGQLSYDKGMRILAATQSDGFAIESESIDQGLLTFALLQGLTARNATQYNADLDGDNQVILGEWLRYAEQRVPRIYAAISRQQIKLKVRDPSFDPRLRSQVTRLAQMPTLFDFGRTADRLVVARSAQRNSSTQQR